MKKDSGHDFSQDEVQIYFVHHTKLYNINRQGSQYIGRINTRFLKYGKLNT